MRSSHNIYDPTRRWISITKWQSRLRVRETESGARRKGDCLSNLQLGIESMQELITLQSRNQQPDTLRYVVGVFYLANKLRNKIIFKNNNPATLRVIQRV